MSLRDYFLWFTITTLLLFLRPISFLLFLSDIDCSQAWFFLISESSLSTYHRWWNVRKHILIYSLLNGKLQRKKLLRWVKKQIPIFMLDVCSCGENIFLQSQHFQWTFELSDSHSSSSFLRFNFTVYKPPELVCLPMNECLRTSHIWKIWAQH